MVDNLCNIVYTLNTNVSSERVIKKTFQFITLMVVYCYAIIVNAFILCVYYNYENGSIGKWQKIRIKK